jgi:hypothetical protein
LFYYLGDGITELSAHTSRGHVQERAEKNARGVSGHGLKQKAKVTTSIDF